MAQGVNVLTRAGQVVNGAYYATAERYPTPIAGLGAIPPERVGLTGEYDYYGLTKRVQAAFYSRFGRPNMARLVLKQRGSTIILSGQVDSQALVEPMVELAVSIDGATHVEVRNLLVNDSQAGDTGVGPAINPEAAAVRVA
ncbi:phospholipid-binding protein [Nodosilinea sp. P-1105]|uniref:phospholipid-binding protein n=1 Tax=Nodosilinea sp. P-1105 TaxID=2546229 RepID=UPI00146F0D50|nr:phospholipid-binding protein [Nodosilinea sp. P-1105]NMF83862.1 phospholipid-binding protein [Nodosilinea sp. P-1105]